MTGLSTAAILVSAEFTLLKLEDIPEQVKIVAETVKNFFITDINIPVWLTIMAGALLYIFGTVLPDIDTPYSMVGRHVHLPFKHRTWTHALWFPIVFCVAGIFFKPLFWLGIGMVVHDFWDALSISGIHWFYPFRKDKPHKIKLYHTGKTSEYVTDAVVIIIAVACVLLSIWLVYHPFDIVLR